jgi:hypothetical protein
MPPQTLGLFPPSRAAPALNPSAEPPLAARARSRHCAAAPLPPAVNRPSPEHHEVVRKLPDPPFSLSPALPRPHGSHRRPAPPLAAGRRPRPPPLPLSSLIGFPTTPSSSPSRSEPKSTRETHYCVKSGEPPPPPPRRRRPAAAPAPSRAASAPPPSDRDPAAHARSKPRVKRVRYRSTVLFLQNSPYVFPDSTRTPSEFKSNRVLVLFLLFRPL